MHFESVIWLLERVEFLVGSKNWGHMASRKNIFAGCYDVWHSPGDADEGRRIMEDRLKQSKELGFIENSQHPIYKATEIWKLTPAGEAFLQKERNEHMA